MSGALRHFPDDAGLNLDDRGWTSEASLIEAVDRKYDWAGPTHVDAVIETDPKGRFERTAVSTSDDRAERRRGYARAAYGHSVDVDLEPTETPVPAELYHGTAPRNLASIRETGLQPMSRQQVHLSGTIETARQVGHRHTSEPIVLAIDAAAMIADGHRIAKRGQETYTTDRVPPDYLSERSESDVAPDRS